MLSESTRDIVIRLDGTTKQIMGMVVKLDKDINGNNGTPGLKTDLQALKIRVTDVEKRHGSEDEEVKEKKNRSWDIHKGILLLTVGQILTLGGLIIVAMLKVK